MSGVTCILIVDEDDIFSYRSFRSLYAALSSACLQDIFGNIVVLFRGDNTRNLLLRHQPIGPISVRMKSADSDWSVEINRRIDESQCEFILLLQADTLISSNFIVASHGILHEVNRGIAHPEILIEKSDIWHMHRVQDQMSQHFNIHPFIVRNIWGNIVFTRREHLMAVPFCKSAYGMAAEFWRWNGEAVADRLTHRVALRTLAMRKISDYCGFTDEIDVAHSHSRIFGFLGVW